MSESCSAVRGTESLICQEKHRERNTNSDRLLLIYIFYASVHHAQIPVSDFRAHLFRPRGIRSPNSIKKKHRSTPGNKEFMHDDQQAGGKATNVCGDCKVYSQVKEWKKSICWVTLSACRAEKFLMNAQSGQKNNSYRSYRTGFICVMKANI